MIFDSNKGYNTYEGADKRKYSSHKHETLLHFCILFFFFITDVLTYRGKGRNEYIIFNIFVNLVLYFF